MRFKPKQTCTTWLQDRENWTDCLSFWPENKAHLLQLGLKWEVRLLTKEYATIHAKILSLQATRA